MKGSHSTWQTEAVTCAESPQRRSESNGPATLHVRGCGQRKTHFQAGAGLVLWGPPGVFPLHAACPQGEGADLMLAWACQALGLERWNNPRVGQDVVTQEFCLSRRVLHSRRGKGRREDIALDVERIGTAIRENQPQWQGEKLLL